MIESDIPLDEADAWRAVLARDRTADGRFVTGVLSTGIYCRPSCAARHPKRENVRFFTDPAAALASGLRACLRCRPDATAADEEGIARAIRLIEQAEAPPSLDAMARVAGYSPYHFHRLFRRATGVTPAAYARSVRARRMEAALSAEPDVTSAVYAAGYAAPARFYADATARLGMTPSVWQDGGRDMTIRWTIAETDLGPLLVAATDRGICRVAFGEEGIDLAALFPRAVLKGGGAELAEIVGRVVASVSRPGNAPSLPRDVRGGAFQEAVWAALAKVPPRAPSAMPS